MSRRRLRSVKSNEGPAEDSQATLTAPPIALADDIDLSKAKPGCSRCHGRGIRGTQIINTAEGATRVPVICRCVTRNGGVKPRGMARVMEQLGDDGKGEVLH